MTPGRSDHPQGSWDTGLNILCVCLLAFTFALRAINYFFYTLNFSYCVFRILTLSWLNPSPSPFFNLWPTEVFMSLVQNFKLWNSSIYFYFFLTWTMYLFKFFFFLYLKRYIHCPLFSLAAFDIHFFPAQSNSKCVRYGAGRRDWITCIWPFPSTLLHSSVPEDCLLSFLLPRH